MGALSPVRRRDLKCHACSVGVAFLMQLGVVVASSGPIAARDVCSNDYGQSLCAVIPAVETGEELCGYIMQSIMRTRYYINASQDTIETLLPSFHRDMADGNVSEITQGNVAFLLQATETNLDGLHGAYGELVVAARGMCDHNSGQGG